jgi:hypothetical protein
LESEWSRFARTATTIIILTPAHLMATTDLAGLWADCSSALARGMAGTVDGAMVGTADAATTVGAALPDAGTLDAGTPDAGTLDAGTPDAVTLVDVVMLVRGAAE